MRTHAPAVASALHALDCISSSGTPSRHLGTVTYSRRPSDLLRTRYWVHCIDCDLTLGPYSTQAAAKAESKRLNQAFKNAFGF